LNTDRVLRDIEQRLAHLPAAVRAEAVDAVREEIARDRRREGPMATIEAERERRLEAETLRAILEAISRHGTLEETIDEVLKQLAKVVTVDSCSIALLDADEHFRIIAARGFPAGARVVGVAFKDALTEMLRRSTSAVAVGDVLDDDRFRPKTEGTPAIRSWAGIPLLVEGEVIGLVSLDRHRVDPFADEDLHRAKAVAFSAAAAIRKAQLHERVRRYAALMERLVQVDQAVFAGRPVAEIGRLILDGALGVGAYTAGILVLDGAAGRLRVAAASGVLGLDAGHPVPAALAPRATTRLSVAEVARIAARARLKLPRDPVFAVPLATDDRRLGALVLFDPNGLSADDRLMEAFASRAAAAYRHATVAAPRARRAAGRGPIARVRSAVRSKVKATLASRLKAQLRGKPAARRPGKRRRP
jgi:GAF domain-containing protein